jgi:hypothetical protein
MKTMLLTVSLADGIPEAERKPFAGIGRCEFFLKFRAKNAKRKRNVYKTGRR